MKTIDEQGRLFAPAGTRTCTLDAVNMRSLTKIYCVCGRIVDLDAKEMNMKLSLRKNIECPVCRNARISRDIDCLDKHYECRNEEETGF